MSAPIIVSIKAFAILQSALAVCTIHRLPPAKGHYAPPHYQVGFEACKKIVPVATRAVTRQMWEITQRQQEADMVAVAKGLTVIRQLKR